MNPIATTALAIGLALAAGAASAETDAGSVMSKGCFPHVIDGKPGAEAMTALAAHADQEGPLGGALVGSSGMVFVEIGAESARACELQLMLRGGPAPAGLSPSQVRQEVLALAAARGMKPAVAALPPGDAAHRDLYCGAAGGREYVLMLTASADDAASARLTATLAQTTARDERCDRPLPTSPTGDPV